MRQGVIIASLIGSFLVFALTIDLFDTLFMFVLFGIIPGRVEPLSANQMLLIYAVASLGTIAYALRGRITLLVRLLAPVARQHSRAS